VACLDQLNDIVRKMLKNPHKETDELEKVEKLRKGIRQSELRKIVYVVARGDCGDHKPSEGAKNDAMHPPKSSLRGFWWVLEIGHFKQRKYASSGGTVDTEPPKWTCVLCQPS
jgi:hypothetical protein